MWPSAPFVTAHNSFQVPHTLFWLQLPDLVQSSAAFVTTHTSFQVSHTPQLPAVQTSASFVTAHTSFQDHP